jgi:DNA-directed RNA polymerase subunit RPC12/RpoP
MASLKFECPVCGSSIEADLDTSGATINCPHCSSLIRVPSAGPASHIETGQPSAVSATSAAAVWSFVLSLLSIFCLGMLTGIPAIICGHVAVSNINRSRGTLTGKGLAIAGLVIGYLSVFAWLIYFFLFGGLALLDALSQM